MLRKREREERVRDSIRPIGQSGRSGRILGKCLGQVRDATMSPFAELDP